VILTPDLSSATKKIKIELEDAHGQKYNLTVQGNLSKEKIMHVIEFAQLFEKDPIESSFEHKEGNGKLGLKLWNLITENFKHHTFTSSDLLRIYQDLYYEGIQLSVISIYLSRFYLKKQLNRSKNGKQWVYSLLKENVNYEKENYKKSNQAKLLSAPTVYDLHL
jgi:hypothetical protein